MYAMYCVHIMCYIQVHTLGLRLASQEIASSVFKIHHELFKTTFI